MRSAWDPRLVNIFVVHCGLAFSIKLPKWIRKVFVARSKRFVDLLIVSHPAAVNCEKTDTVRLPSLETVNLLGENF